MYNRQSFEYARILELIKTLFENYKIFRDENLRTLLHKLGIQLEYIPLDSVTKSYLKGFQEKFIIQLPEENISPKLEKFLIYHEIAHWILIKYQSYSAFGKEEYWECECWCDSFALAMLFYELDFVIVDETNFEDFFQDGSELKNVDMINLHVARRIEQLAEKAKHEENKDTSSLISLAKIICSHAPSSQSDI